MLHEAIRLRCEEYHKTVSAYDSAYTRYLGDVKQGHWDNPSLLNYYDAKRLVDFVNEWKSRMPSDKNNVEKVLYELRRAVPKLGVLRDTTILDVDFDQVVLGRWSIGELIRDSFDGIARAGKRYESVATSKMLNVAFNPSLFVMWDGAIQSGYGTDRYGYDYAYKFLPRMQELARQAVTEVMEEECLSREDAVKSFTNHCKNGNSLAKIIDEYNYARFTLKPTY